MARWACDFHTSSAKACFKKTTSIQQMLGLKPHTLTGLNWTQLGSDSCVPSDRSTPHVSHQALGTSSSMSTQWHNLLRAIKLSIPIFGDVKHNRLQPIDSILRPLNLSKLGPGWSIARVRELKIEYVEICPMRG